MGTTTTSTDPEGAAADTTNAGSTNPANDTTSTAGLGTSSDDAPADSTTGEPVPTEWVGTYTPSLFYGSFSPCGEEQSYLTQGSLPSDPYAHCSLGFVPGPYYLRLLAIEHPPPRRFERPLLEVLEVLEGPCLGSLCDPGMPPTQCGSWEDLCSNGLACDPFVQDCPRGEKCMPWDQFGDGSWSYNRCARIVDMPGQPGDPCTVMGSLYSGLDDCDIGQMCWNVDPVSLQGTCVEMCQGSLAEPVCPTPGTGCAIAYEAPISLCLPPCEPLLDDCPEGHGCYPTQEGLFCLPAAPGA